MLALVADSAGPRRDALRVELARHGHDVALVATAEEVLTAAVGADPLVVLAPRVGRDDAVALCRALLAGAPGGRQPVVVLVGGPGEVDVEAALGAGASDVWLIPPDRGPEALDVRLELARHYARLQAENLRVGGEFALMRQALDLAGTGFVLSDPRLDDDPIVYANRAFCEMTGYAEEEVVGRNCRFLQGPSTDPADVDRLREALAAERAISLELLNHRKDGTPFFNELHMAPVRDASGEVVRHVGIQIDVTTYRVQDQRFALEQQARRAAETAERRSAFLAAASPVLDARLDLGATLETLVRLSVPDLAEVCLVETVRDGVVQRVAASAADPDLERELLALPTTYEIDPEGPDPLARVLRQGRAELVADADGPVVGAEVDAVLATRRRGARLRWMLVPLRARGRSIGVLALASLDGARSFGIEELALATDLAGRAALALDNARLYEQQVEVARTLQASFLPDRLPTVRGVELATRYRPADSAVDIGGDFYDVLDVGGGVTALTVGDVAGKGAPAAALTGLCRHTLRAAWGYERRPEAVLHALNRALVSERRERGRYATVVVMTLEEVADGVAVEGVCAGHPAPRILRAGGRVEALDTHGTILGWREQLELRPARAVLAPGDTLVAFTDGVSAGDAGGPLTAGALDAVLARSAGADLDRLVGRLQAAAMRAQEGRPADDVVILAARATG